MQLLSPPVSVKWYALTDYCMSAGAWLLICLFRYYLLDSELQDFNNVLGSRIIQLQAFIYIPAFWLTLYTIMGGYNQSLYNKSRLSELSNTIVQSLTGCVFLFFVLVINDRTQEYFYFIKLFLAFWFLQTTLIFIGRLLLINIARHHLHKGSYYINTVFIGDDKDGFRVYKEFENNADSFGYKTIGYLSDRENHSAFAKQQVKRLGRLDDAEHVIEDYNIQQVVLSLTKEDMQTRMKLVDMLSEKDVAIKITPTTYDILTGSVKTDDVLGTSLINISTNVMPVWQENIKRVIDVFFAIIGLIVLSPFLLLIMLKTKLSSPGPVFYLQQRIGYKGKPFTIYKFRSMVADAEKNGPMLSQESDERITRWGKFMRKWRLDELPQLWNILIGDMSLVGPRPERKFYIDQLNRLTPYYKYLLKVKPGLTSWGMVRFGYASSLEEMIERMQYDLIYLENASLLIDLKIMVYSLKIILTGKGK